MTELITRRRENTRQRLLDAAFKVFVEEGFTGASIETIAEAAGFTRGAFYSNFETKEDLFIELLQKGFQRRLERAVGAFADVEDQLFEADSVSPEGIGKLIASTLSEGADERDWQILYTEFELFALRNPDVDPAIRELNATYTAEVVKAITPLLQSIGVHFVGEPETIIQTVMTAYMSVARGTYLNPELDAETALAQQMEWFAAMLERLVERDNNAGEASP